MRITRITVENVLGVRSAAVDLGKPIALFAGANAAGKSSLQEAIRMALTGETVRVGLKKEYPQLVTEGARDGWVEVLFDGAGKVEGDAATMVLPSGKANEAYVMPRAMPYLLDAQRFAGMDDKERRSFLFGLMGLKLDLATITGRMTMKGLAADKIKLIEPFLRSGFETAHTEAAKKATEAKGAWRAITKEVYGAVKAVAWKAAKPEFDQLLIDQYTAELHELDTQIDDGNQALGELRADKRNSDERQQQLVTLRERAETAERHRAKLAVDEPALAEWEKKVADATAAAGGVRVGLVHDLAAAVHDFLVTAADKKTPEFKRGNTALQAYEKEHGAIGAKGDTELADRLGEFTQARDLLSRSIANTRRDLAPAEAAEAALRETKETVAVTTTDDQVTAAQAAVQTLQARRAETNGKLTAANASKVAAEAADAATQKAAGHHKDVTEWEAVAAALAPDGIPGDMLAEALGPINARLAQSAADAEWPQVEIGKDMVITLGGRQYTLLSESEKWRVDAMLAEAVSFQSKLKLLVLDRFDVLDIPGRGNLLAWLDVLASNGEIDTALIFGTLKALPADLLSSVQAEWIHNGRVGQLKEAA